MELEFLKALVIVFGVSAMAVFALNRLHIPPLVGFILAGALIGPSGIGIIENVHEIEVLAEIGVVLLLFTIGVEFSLKKLVRIRNLVLFSGGGQVLLTTIVTMLMFFSFMGDLKVSLFFGFLAALSSTAIVLKTLEEKGEVDTQHGRLMFGVLIFQDFCIVPLMLVVPMLAGDSFDISSLMFLTAKAGLIIAAVLISARWAVPIVLHHVVHTRSRELFIITIIFICLGTALLTSRFGLSLALGAFLAGLVISESEYAHQATSEILPFKESFLGLFFVSIGMLVDVRYLIANLPQVLAAIAFILVVKSTTTAFTLMATRSGIKASLHAGLGLAQIGEFSFILAEAGKVAGLISGDLFQLFLVSAVLSMALTPLLHKVAPAFSEWAATRTPFKWLGDMPMEMATPPPTRDHVIIVGFGLNGKNLAHTLRNAGINYIVLETNSTTVLNNKANGEPIYYGDATSMNVLEKMGIDRARVLVVAIAEPAGSRKIVALARGANPDLHIVVRTRYQAEIEDLAALGADTVIPEEFETSVEIFSQVLDHYNIPRNLISDQISAIRKNRYEALRTHEIPRKSISERDDIMSGLKTENYHLRKGSPFDGQNLIQIDLRSATGATLIAVERNGEIIHNPRADFILNEKDMLLLVGKPVDISRAVQYLEAGEGPPQASISDNLYDIP